MFPNPNNDLQMLVQMRAIQEMRESFREIKRSRETKSLQEDLEPLRQAFWFCVEYIGLILNRGGRALEQVGQRFIWLAMRKKAENTPGYYR